MDRALASAVLKSCGKPPWSGSGRSWLLLLFAVFLLAILLAAASWARHGFVFLVLVGRQDLFHFLILVGHDGLHLLTPLILGSVASFHHRFLPVLERGFHFGFLG